MELPSLGFKYNFKILNLIILGNLVEMEMTQMKVAGYATAALSAALCALSLNDADDLMEM